MNRVRTLQNKGLAIRLALMAAVVVYGFLLTWLYREMISPRWFSYGLNYVDPETAGLVIGWTGALLPTLWIPLSVTRPSQVLYWQLYLTVYLPSMFIPYLMGTSTVDELAPVTLYMIAGFGVIGLHYRFPLWSMPKARISVGQFWGLVTAFYCLTLGPYLYVFGSHLRLVNFAERYEVRLADREVSGGIIVEYCRNWLAFALNPLLLALGLIKRKPHLFLIGTSGAVLLYASAASRSWLLVVGYLPLVFLALKKHGRHFGLSLITITNLLFAFIIVLEFAGSTYSQDFSDLFVLRDHVGSGAFTEQYNLFFATHPITYWSHVKGINLIFEYPYDSTIPFVIGDYFSPGNSDLSANAHMWATDGIAAIGPPGVFVISFVVAAVFFAVDCCSQLHEPWVAGLIVVMQYGNLSNIGLFSSVFGGGLLFLSILLWLMPPSLGERHPLRATTHSRQAQIETESAWQSAAVRPTTSTT